MRNERARGTPPTVHGPNSASCPGTCPLWLPELVALARARGGTVFFRSMVLGQLKTIRLRRADGSCYPALFTDLQLYRQQFRGWNRVAAELRRAIGGHDIHHLEPPARDEHTLAKGAPMNPMRQH